MIFIDMELLSHILILCGTGPGVGIFIVIDSMLLKRREIRHGTLQSQAKRDPQGQTPGENTPQGVPAGGKGQCPQITALAHGIAPVSSGARSGEAVL